MAWVAENVAEYEGFAGKTIILLNDIDLTGVKTKGDSFSPIGLCCSKQDVSSPFTGHFDGNGKTIKGIYQSGWDFGYEWGITGYLGFFGYVKDATIENLTIEGMESVVEGGTLAAIAGRADGECTFKNITVKNSKLGTYNNRCGGIVGWTGGYTAEDGTDKCYFTFENINICNDVVLGGLWGSFDSSIGGVMGQLNSGGSASFKNVIVSCRIDAYNDCTASYDYYIEASTLPEVVFTWHGGEAMLRPIEFYEKAIRLQKMFGRGRQIINCIQTNGTLINERWARFLKANNWLMG